MDNLYVNQEDVLNFTKDMCNTFACSIIQKVFENENMNDSEKLKRADITLEIYRRTKDETDIEKIKEAIKELEQEVKEKRENGEV